MQHVTRIPLTTKTCWDLMVAVSLLSEAEQAALLDALRQRWQLTSDDHAWLKASGLTMAQEDER